MGKYNHGEAFCLMWYACQCGHRERIWNSRDGVTPAGMGCPSCGEPTLHHSSWHLDVRVTNHKPHADQGIWRDGTPDEAATFMAERLDKCVGTPYEVDAERRAKLIEIARTATDGEFQPGWPMFERKTGHD